MIDRPLPKISVVFEIHISRVDQPSLVVFETGLFYELLSGLPEDFLLSGHNRIAEFMNGGRRYLQFKFPLLISRISSASLFRKFTILNKLFVIKSEIDAVVRLPVRSQIIFGGKPRSVLRSMKSESKVTIVNPSALANSNISLSEASSRSTWRTCFDPWKDDSNRFTMRGEIFWSNNSFNEQS